MEDNDNHNEYIFVEQATSFAQTAWNSILQSVLITSTGIITATALLGILIFILYQNSERVANIIIPHVFTKLFGLVGIESEEEEYDKTDQDGFTFPCKLAPAPTKISQLQNKTNGVPIDMTQFNQHERQILELLIQSSQLNVTWENIAGSERLIKNIKEQVIFPVLYSNRHSSDPLLLPPKGVLLYGPPGCGKTLIAKALSNEIKANFINFDISLIMQKWVGETEKMASALFTAARKLDPCIIFIDEVDSFLNQRDDSDHSTQSTLKAIFLQQWDGLTTDPQNQIIVLAASNRIDSIDDAILRRLPLQFHVPLPTEEQRLEILEVILKDCDLDQDVKLIDVAQKSKGFSGSDLQEVCRHASTYRLVGYYKKLTTDDFNNELQDPNLMKQLTNGKQQLVNPVDIFQQFKEIRESSNFDSQIISNESETS